MTHRFPRLSALMLAACAACASSVASLGCVANKKEGPKSGERPRAIAQASLLAQAGAAASCPAAGTVLDTGPALVEHGATVGGRSLGVSCKIAKQASGYLVEAKVTYSDGTSLTVASPVDDEGRSAAADVAITRPGGAAWTTDRCKLEPDSNAGPGLGSGRYSAMMNCRGVTSSGAASCDLAGMIRVEGCSP